MRGHHAGLAALASRRRPWAQRLLALLVRAPLRHLRAGYLDPAGLASAAGSGIPLVYLPAHRGYLDTLVLERALREAGAPRPWRLAGANLGFWPLGALGRRSGMIFIRREFGSDPGYHAAVRATLAALLARGQGLEWYPEAGRTRSGRPRPLRNGLPRLLVGAYADARIEDVLVVPASIVYDSLPDIEAVTAEDAGAAKPAEGLRALIRYLRAGRAHGPRHAWIGFAPPISLRSVTLEASGDWDAARTLTRRVAAGQARATQVTAEALLALIFAAEGGGTRLSAEEVVRQFAALLLFAAERRIPVVRPYSIAAACEALIRTRALDRRGDGFAVVDGRERILAYHRNVVEHWFLPRAAAELVASGATTVERISTLLGKPEACFGRQVAREIETLAEDGWERQPFLLAPRLLGPLLSRYHAVALDPDAPTPSAETHARALALLSAEGLLGPDADTAAQADFLRELAGLSARLRVMALLDLDRHDGRGVAPGAAGTTDSAATSGLAHPAATSGLAHPAAASGTAEAAAASGTAEPTVTSEMEHPAASGTARSVATSETARPADTSGTADPAAASGTARSVATSGTAEPAAASGTADPADTSGIADVRG